MSNQFTGLNAAEMKSMIAEHGAALANAGWITIEEQEAVIHDALRVRPGPGETDGEQLDWVAMHGKIPELYDRSLETQWNIFKIIENPSKELDIYDDDFDKKNIVETMAAFLDLEVRKFKKDNSYENDNKIVKEYYSAISEIYTKTHFINIFLDMKESIPFNIKNEIITQNINKIFLTKDIDNMINILKHEFIRKLISSDFINEENKIGWIEKIPTQELSEYPDVFRALCIYSTYNYQEFGWENTCEFAKNKYTYLEVSDWKLIKSNIIKELKKDKKNIDIQAYPHLLSSIQQSHVCRIQEAMQQENLDPILFSGPDSWNREYVYNTLKKCNISDEVCNRILDRSANEQLPQLIAITLLTIPIKEENWRWENDPSSQLLIQVIKIIKSETTLFARSIYKFLERHRHEFLDDRLPWLRGLLFALGKLREPMGGKIPRLLTAMSHDNSLPETIRQDADTQRSLFNRGNIDIQRRLPPEQRIQEALSSLRRAVEKIPIQKILITTKY